MTQNSAVGKLAAVAFHMQGNCLSDRAGSIFNGQVFGGKTVGFHFQCISMERAVAPQV